MIFGTLIHTQYYADNCETSRTHNRAQIIGWSMDIIGVHCAYTSCTEKATRRTLCIQHIVPCSPVGGALSNSNKGIGQCGHCSTNFNTLLDESSSQNVRLSFDQLYPLYSIALSDFMVRFYIGTINVVYFMSRLVILVSSKPTCWSLRSVVYRGENKLRISTIWF